MQLVIVTGLSGSGKSIVMKGLEDSGYYCVDNLPAPLLHQVASHLELAGHHLAAVSIDTRSAQLEDLPQHIEHLKTINIEVSVLFLDSNTETLVKRFSETRRRHPLSNDTRTLAESIHLERELLAELSDMGHRLDTSELSANTLRAWVKDFVALDHSGLALLVESFGFKHGIPLDADMVYDVRCLPNPHYDPKLRPLTGRDAAVIEFLEKEPQVSEMLNDIRDYIEKWLPCFVRDNRSYLTVAIGCTGGRHRSVYFVESLAEYFRKQGQQVLVRHRGLV
ncbi:MAG: RNase adapter RapZ [Methylophilales bacterium]|nr:RNase adapter RapZ [Methylophilales bacterium]